MGSQQYKNHIKQKIRDAAFDFLRTEQLKHKKVKHIEYESYQIQPYIGCCELNNHQVSLLMALRSGMVRGIKSNFSSMYNGNITCPLPSCTEKDSQSHLLKCASLLTELSDKENDEISNIDYNYIYGSLDNQKKSDYSHGQTFEHSRPTPGNSG